VLTGPDTRGQRITIEGRVLDGLGAPGRDVLVEIWQAKAAGRYNHPADPQHNKPLDPDFRGWGRTGTDFATGLYRFETVKPGPVIGRRGHKPMAPHVNVWLAARGINIGLATRLYFGDEAELNEADSVLRMIEPSSTSGSRATARQYFLMSDTRVRLRTSFDFGGRSMINGSTTVIAHLGFPTAHFKLNATPIGIHDGDPLPIRIDRVAPPTFVGEVVMREEFTPLLRAKEKGCPIQVGTDMLFEQIPAYLEFFGYGTSTPEELRSVAKLQYA
jgi:protocatechuate 3,4-dioxygenase alpha subunit